MAKVESDEEKDGKSQGKRLKSTKWSPWNRLDGYIFSEIHYPFLMAMLVTNGIFFIQTLGEVSEFSGGKFEVPVKLLFLLFLKEIPEILFLTTTISFLLGALIAIGRMSSDSEIIAPQSVGISFWRLNRPVFTYALILTLFMFFIANWGAPRLNQIAKNAFYHFANNDLLPTIDAGVITPLGQDSVLFVDHIDPGNNASLADLIIIDKKENNEEVLMAKNAMLYTNRALKLFNFTNIRLPSSPDQGPEISDWESWNAPFPLPKNFEMERLKMSSKDLLNTPQLYTLISRPQPTEETLIYELYRRLMTPFIFLVFSLFPVPLAAKHSRNKGSSGFWISLTLIGVYFLLDKSGRDATRDGTLHAAIGVGAPMALLLLLGMLVQIGKNRWWSQNFYRIGQPIAAAFQWLLNLLSGWVKLLRKSDRSTTGRASSSTFVFPSKLDFYTSRSFFSIYFLVQSTFVLIFMLVEYVQISKFIRVHNPDREVVFRYFIYKFPEIINLTMFACLLISVLVLFAVMSRNQEVTAIRASGGSLHRLCLPLLLYGILISAAGYYFENSFLPQTNSLALSAKNKIKNSNPAMFRRDVWLRTSSGEIVNYKHFDAKNKLLVGVNRYKLDRTDNRSLQITRNQNLRYRNGWEFQDPGEGWQFDFEGEILRPLPMELKAGQRLDLELDPSDLTQKKRRASELSISELKEHLVYLKNLGYSEANYETELYAKFSKPLMPLVMMLLAMPLGFQFGRRGTFYGIAVGLIAGLAFLGLFEIVKQMGSTGVLSPLAAGWIVVVLFGSVSLYRFINME